MPQTDAAESPVIRRPLTPAAIRAIRPPASGRKDYPDTNTRGLNLRVPADGEWVWTLRMRDSAGNLRRFVLGTMTAERGLAWARKEAERLRQGVRHGGRDPHRERRDRKEAERLTLAALVEDWQTLKLADRKPGYAAEAVRALKHAFATAWGRPAAALTTAEVRKVLDRMTKAGRAGIASGTMRYGRAAFAWAMKRGAVSTNPFEGQDAPGVKSRDRTLSDGELVEVLAAVAGMGGTFGAIVHVLALTGQRREEVAGMVWGEIAQDRSMWILPPARTKNSREHLLPLSLEVQALLPKERGDGLVFPGERQAKVYNAWSQAKVRLDAAIAEAREKAAGESGGEAKPMVAWRLHDLRRTVATGLQRLGVRLEVTEAVLNHRSGSRGGIVGVYQTHDWAKEKASALQAWATKVASLTGSGGEGDGRGNIVELR